MIGVVFIRLELDCTYYSQYLTGFHLWLLYRRHFFSSDFHGGEIMEEIMEEIMDAVTFHVGVPAQSEEAR